VTSRPCALVLGAAGFIGRHTSRSLAALGCRVVGVGHGRWTDQEASEFGIQRWIEADIAFDALSGLTTLGEVDCVVHCGGSGSVSYSYAEPWQDFQRATATTAAVLEWMRQRAGTRARLVLVSSAAVYGDQGDTDAMETSVRSPISPYGFHKLCAEMLCESSSRFFDIPISIVRLFSVYGEGLRKQLLWEALTKFQSGESKFFGTGNELRDWIHVEDAAALLASAAVSRQPTFEIYNGGSEHATTREVLTRLASEYGHGQPIVFSGESHKGNPSRLTSHRGHTTRLLDWAPKIPLEEGIRRYAAWFKTHHHPSCDAGRKPAARAAD
jgi:UDP-glucose 4-epimerase